MSERPSDRWFSLIWSVVLHGALIGILAVGFWRFGKPPKPEPIAPAIDAMVVDSKSFAAIPASRRAPPEPAPKPPEPTPEPTPPAEPPQPSPEEVAQQEREKQQKKDAEEKQLADQARIADEKRVADERADAERKQQAEAERKAQEEADRKTKEAEAKKREEDRKAAEQKKIDDAKRVAEEKRKAEEERQEAERQSELQKSLEAEERAVALRNSGAMASWIQQITARIQRAWIKPASARAGIDCTLLVTQVPGGEVVSVRVAACNGDQAVRESIEAAAYRASPLPPPPDPAMFDRNLEIRFRPVD